MNSAFASSLNPEGARNLSRAYDVVFLGLSEMILKIKKLFGLPPW